MSMPQNNNIWFNKKFFLKEQEINVYILIKFPGDIKPDLITSMTSEVTWEHKEYSYIIM